MHYLQRRNIFLVLLLLVGGITVSLSCGSTSSPDNAAVPASKRIPLPDMGPESPYPVLSEKGVAIVRNEPQRTILYADVFRPAVEGRFPALLEGVAYRREIFELIGAPDPDWLASQGYVVILMDVRGTGSSEGKWEAFSDEEIADMVWMIDHWIPQQAWSNGKVGMVGPSYMGVIQYLTAARKPEHLKAIFPGVSMADAYRDIFYQGGIFNQEFIFLWAVTTVGLSVIPGTQICTDPLSAIKALCEHVAQIPELIQWLEMTTDQEFFWQRSPMFFWNDLADIPIFATGGWFCIFTRGSLLNQIGLTAQASGKKPWVNGIQVPRRIVMGPWYHITGARLEGLPGNILHKRWFDWHLKADEDPKYPYYDILDPKYPVSIYVLGKEQWRKERQWPLPRARYTSLYLSGERQRFDQNISLNNGSLLWPEEVDRQPEDSPGTVSTRLAHHPPEYAGRWSRSPCRWMVGFTASSPSSEDERMNELLTLTFSTAPLTRDIEVTGPIVLRLWARTHFEPPSPESVRLWQDIEKGPGKGIIPFLPQVLEPDVHWVVNLNDVYPDGRVRNLTSGWLAASHRPDPERPDWTQTGYDPFAYPQDQNPSLPEDGALYQYVIEIWPASNLFKAGHQIRIDLVNSDVPHLLPSLVPSGSEILHDQEHPSRLVLPLVDPESTDPRQWIEDPQRYFSGTDPSRDWDR